MKQASTASLLGILLRAPAVAGFAIFGLSLAPLLIEAQPAFAQLPPVNMGKFVHQPGDNQYSSGTQSERHGPPGGYQVVNPSPQQTQGPSGWSRTIKRRPDISLEPIVCDEPIARAGFPPIPDSLELPGLRNATFSNASMGGGGGGGRMYGGGGGGAPGMSSGPGVPENHGSYQHYQPGAFKAGNKTGKGAEEYSSHDGAAAPRGGGGGGSSAINALNRMGKEPSLSNKGTADAAPEAPQAVQINQSSTQDLSLPDDQQSSGSGRKSQSQIGRGVKRMGRRVGRQIMRPLYSMPIRMPMGGH